MKSRLFIALNIPENIQEKIIALRKSIYDDETLKWESQDKFHITLKFLGDVEEEKSEEIIQALERTSSKSNKVELAFNRFGLFFRNNRPGILWAGFSYNDDLIFLQNIVETEMSKLGFQKEKRKYKPHLTLNRLKGRENRKKIEELIKFRVEEIKFYSDKVELIESRLSSEGSEYIILKSFSLS